MSRQYYQLPDHLQVASAKDGIVEVETTDLTNELMDRFDVMAERLAEELDLPVALVLGRLLETVEELTILGLFKGTRNVQPDPVASPWSENA